MFSYGHKRGFALIVAIFLAGPTRADTPFVRPGNGIARDVPVWGHRNGLRLGLAPTPGPRGLIRVYAPYLDQEFPRVVNFISIEPSARDQAGRDQSELQMSRDQPGRRGLSFWATNQRDAPRPEAPVPGRVDDTGETLRLFIQTEPFENGTHPIIECLFRRSAPHEVEFVTHAAPDSAPMTSCVLSATMGNYGLLRQIHLKDDRVVSARDLWKEDRTGRLGFLPWRVWPADQLRHTSDGRVAVRLSTDVLDPSSVRYDRRVAAHWRYTGRKAAHSWRTSADAEPAVAVNGRSTYWMSMAPIPGGTAFENFELRLPFRPGNRLWFSVQPD